MRFGLSRIPNNVEPQAIDITVELANQTCVADHDEKAGNGHGVDRDWLPIIRPEQLQRRVLRAEPRGMAIPLELGWSWLRLDRIRFSRAQLGTQLEHFEGFSGWFRRLLADRKPLTDAGLELVPGGGIEPSTHGFSVRCSTD